jgi:hypothetical protein
MLSAVVFALMVFTPQEANSSGLIRRRYRKMLFAASLGSLLIKSHSHRFKPLPIPLPVPIPLQIHKKKSPVLIADKAPPKPEPEPDWW